MIQYRPSYRGFARLPPSIASVRLHSIVLRCCATAPYSCAHDPSDFNAGGASDDGDGPVPAQLKVRRARVVFDQSLHDLQRATTLPSSKSRKSAAARQARFRVGRTVCHSHVCHGRTWRRDEVVMEAKAEAEGRMGELRARRRRFSEGCSRK